MYICQLFQNVSTEFGSRFSHHMRFLLHQSFHIRLQFVLTKHSRQHLEMGIQSSQILPKSKWQYAADNMEVKEPFAYVQDGCGHVRKGLRDIPH